jgi:tRNA-binding protein
MNAFYNKEGVGDTLLISLKDVTREQVGYEKYGDVVKIFNS